MSTGSGFSGRDWADIISGVGQGVSNAVGSGAQSATGKRELKEAKRRTLADLLSRAMKRDLSLFRTGQEYSDEMSDIGAQTMQNVARGFTDSMKGLTRRK